MNTMSDLINCLKKGLCLLSAGSIDDYNTMTIGWATFGIVWSKNVCIVYVKPNRYTYEFMEKNDYFSLSFFDDSYKNEMLYLGTKSGRDCDKVKDCNFNPYSIDEFNAVSFKEAKYTIVCKKIYNDDFDDALLEEIKKRYYINEPFHRFYIGEIMKETNF